MDLLQLEDRLVAALKQDALILRQKELEYYVERYTNITTQASIVAGFSFDALVELDITQELHEDLVEDGNEWVEVLYYTAASCAMACVSPAFPHSTLCPCCRAPLHRSLPYASLPPTATGLRSSPSSSAPSRRSTATASRCRARRGPWSAQ